MSGRRRRPSESIARRYARPPVGRVVTLRVWWMIKGHNDAPRSPTTTCAAVTAGLTTKAMPARPITLRNAEGNGVALMDAHWTTFFENSPRKHRSLGGLTLLLRYPAGHPRPPLGIGYRIAAPSRLVVRLGAGFVWHVR